MKRYMGQFAGLALMGLFVFGCDSIVNQQPVADEEFSAEQTIQGSVVMENENQPCQKQCIDPEAPEYFEVDDEYVVSWGGRDNDRFSKTVAIKYYNTLTDFVLKVKSSDGIADILMDGESIKDFEGTIAEDTWHQIAFPLDDDWQACDPWTAGLKVTGYGPPAYFAVAYQLIGECDECTHPTLTLSVNPENAGAVTGAGKYPEGQEVELTATANEGFEFVNWTDGEGVEVSDAAAFTYIMPAGDITLTANFSEESVDNAFITTWNTSLGAGTTVTLALAGTVNATIDWGDGTVEHVTTPGPHIHDYGVDGIYTVKVTGAVSSYSNLYGGPFSEQQKLVSVDAWGALGFTGLSFAFQNASNLIAVPCDSDGIEAVTHMNFMFAHATLFNHDISGWDVSNVTTMAGMFHYARAFNQNIGNWDVSNVTNMRYMLSGTHEFNQDIGGWDVSNVTDMMAMFSNAHEFNQYIGDWDVSNVTDMNNMFTRALAFNQDIGGWDVSNVKIASTFYGWSGMTAMFAGAQEFNQDLSGWCVELIPTKPELFDDDATSWTLPDSRPVWGTCPVN